jgi:hypothetical protein
VQARYGRCPGADPSTKLLASVLADVLASALYKVRLSSSCRIFLAQMEQC